MARNWTIVVLLFLAMIPALAQDQDSTVLEEIRSTFGFPGLAAAVMRDETVQKRAVGLRKIGNHDAKLQSIDKFQIGSNTKAMTSTLIGMLIDQGVLGWNTTLPDALPELAGKIDEGHRNTTIAMLGAHRSGIRGSFLADLEFFLYHLDSVSGRSVIVELALSEAPLGVPGEFLYDNTNYVILGRIVENLMGAKYSSWEETMVDELFTPLGMDCGFGTPPESSERSVENPWGHYIQNETDARPIPIPVGGPLYFRDYPPAYGPAAIVHCDMESYAAFARLHIDGFNGHPTQINISQETFKMLHTPYSPSNGSESYTLGGWYYNDGSMMPWSNGPTLRHAGSNNAFFTTAVLAPKLGDRGTILSVYTNVGLPLAGGVAPTLNGSLAVLQAIVDGRLFR